MPSKRELNKIFERLYKCEKLYLECDAEVFQISDDEEYIFALFADESEDEYHFMINWFSEIFPMLSKLKELILFDELFDDFSNEKVKVTNRAWTKKDLRYKFFKV